MRLEQLLNPEESTQCLLPLAQPEPKPKKIGRPRKPKRKKPLGRRPKKRPFEDTNLGYYLQYEAPIEYKLIKSALGEHQTPSADFIEALSYASINPLFRKPKFRRALMEYREHGVHQKHRHKTDEKTIELHRQIYSNQMATIFNGG